MNLDIQPSALTSDPLHPLFALGTKKQYELRHMPFAQDWILNISKINNIINKTHYFVTVVLLSHYAIKYLNPLT
jgi:hypothetical protein